MAFQKLEIVRLLVRCLTSDVVCFRLFQSRAEAMSPPKYHLFLKLTLCFLFIVLGCCFALHNLSLPYIPGFLSSDHDAYQRRLSYNGDTARRPLKRYVKRCHHRRSSAKTGRIRTLLQCGLILFWWTTAATKQETQERLGCKLSFDNTTCSTAPFDGKQEYKDERSEASEISRRLESQPRA
jgi:hypothetical protein